MAFPYDHPRTRSACRGGVTDEKPRPAEQQQAGGPTRSRRVGIAPWDEPTIGLSADNSRVCDLENRATLHRIGPECARLPMAPGIATRLRAGTAFGS